MKDQVTLNSLLPFPPVNRRVIKRQYIKIEAADGSNNPHGRDITPRTLAMCPLLLRLEALKTVP